MKFGVTPVIEAAGGILAHQARAGAVVFKKGHVLDAADCTALAQAGLVEVTIARPEPGDVGEDEAARRLGDAAKGQGVRADVAFTGRVNLFAEHAGVFLPNKAAIDAFNALDPGMTLATLAAFAKVEAGEMVGTVKIIPFAMEAASVTQGGAALAAAPLQVLPFLPKRVALLLMSLPGLKDSVLKKTEAVTRERIEGLGGTLTHVAQLEHRREALDAALAGLHAATFDLLIIFGAAAIADRRDIIPAAIEAAGGRIEHLGMPVDPGNLLLLAAWQGKPVIGAPGCARSARENGFDWVLARIFAELPVGAREIMGMGVGGLLMEIISRPQPRAGEGEEPMGQEIAALVLAAGRSTRFGSENKLLALLNGKPLVAHVVQAAQDAGLAPLVVTGHEAEMVGAVLPGLRSVHNPSYAEGMASSLRAGVAALPETVGAALVMLGDMPKVKASTLEALKAAAKTPGIKAVVPAFAGRRGNPVLLTRALFPSVMALHGDAGARKLLESAGDAVLVLEVDDPGVLADFDTPQALAQITQ